MSKATTVQRCPFCGDLVKVRICMKGLHFFYCTNIAMCGAIVSFQGGQDRAEAKDPIDNWNHRVFLLAGS